MLGLTTSAKLMLITSRSYAKPSCAVAASSSSSAIKAAVASSPAERRRSINQGLIDQMIAEI